MASARSRWFYFDNGSKPLILNTVNWDTIETGYGPDRGATAAPLTCLAPRRTIGIPAR
jgi:hypothetical protein